jgi:hypothetical protein
MVFIQTLNVIRSIFLKGARRIRNKNPSATEKAAHCGLFSLFFFARAYVPKAQPEPEVTLLRTTISILPRPSLNVVRTTRQMNTLSTRIAYCRKNCNFDEECKYFLNDDCVVEDRAQNSHICATQLDLKGL